MPPYFGGGSQVFGASVQQVPVDSLLVRVRCGERVRVRYGERVRV